MTELNGSRVMRMGATAAAGAKQASKLPSKPKKSAKRDQVRKPLGTPGDRAIAEALDQYLRAKNKLLSVTGSGSVDAALVKGSAATKRLDEERRRRRNAAANEQQASKRAKAQARTKSNARKMIFDSRSEPKDAPERSMNRPGFDGCSSGWFCQAALA